MATAVASVSLRDPHPATTGVITHAAALLDVRGDGEVVVTAATYIEDHGFTPFDALHLVESDGDTIVSSDDTYDAVAPRRDLTDLDDE